MHSGRARSLREVTVLRAHERVNACFKGNLSEKPRAALARWGVNVVVGQKTPYDHLASRVEQVDGDARSVEAVESVVWIGEDLILLRLAMVDLVSGEMFERLVVLDCAREEVEYLMHDLRSTSGEVVRAVPSKDARHVWFQCLRVEGTGMEARQLASADGAVLELHRVPLSRLLYKECVPQPLYGPLTRICAPTASMMTSGERTELAPGELALVDDVEAGERGALSFVTMLGVRQAAGADMRVLNLCELSLDTDGSWRSTDLFGTLSDEEWMVL